MTDRELMQQVLEALEEINKLSVGENAICLPAEIDTAMDALRERLAQPEQDWDWRHPKAQALIGAKARLEIKLRLVEQLVEDPNLETTASDMEYWEPLHDKLQERLAQPEQEPVAWAYHEGLEAFKSGKPWTAYGSNGDGRIPLYLNDAVAQKAEPRLSGSGAGFESLPASPKWWDDPVPQMRREWKGLTDEEREQFRQWAHPDIIEAIELKLQQRNT